MKLTFLSFLVLGLLLSSSNAFTPYNIQTNNAPNGRIITNTQLFNSNDKKDLNQIIKGIFTNPVTNAKKALVQSLAGNYDKEQIQNELSTLIQNEPILMLSFTT